jgi:hypothetical protein
MKESYSMKIKNFEQLSMEIFHKIFAQLFLRRSFFAYYSPKKNFKIKSRKKSENINSKKY